MQQKWLLFIELLPSVNYFTSIASLILTKLWRKYYHQLPLKYEGFEVHLNFVTCPRLERWQFTEPGFKSRWRTSAYLYMGGWSRYKVIRTEINAFFSTYKLCKLGQVFSNLWISIYSFLNGNNRGLSTYKVVGMNIQNNVCVLALKIHDLPFRQQALVECIHCVQHFLAQC